MKNIVFTRIDDRLLHGQVMVSWIPFLSINEVLIIDDEYAADEFMADLIVEAAPANLDVKVLSVQDSAQYILSESSDTRVLIISRSIESIYKLMEMNVPIQKINVGGLGYLEGRKKYFTSIHMSDNEFELLKEIANKGVSVEVQILPKDKSIEIK